ncbi:MAG: tRNA (N6-threonylcarbamoyladenosine(37)-N6)-methyltransferase TrmO [Nitrospiraceae bacterium]|nr:MAG: tRNA (N6-threonylcarbamoyladenosine(37)-N6)-methyltransferase TrmO [Nitrospiraceae bacterium]
MTEETHYCIQPIGLVRSPLKSLEDCPKQGWEGAPEAWLEIYPAFSGGLDDLKAGEEILVLTWLHLARRDLLKVHPRGDRETPLKGVFAMRSPHRPNPIGLHRVRVLEITASGRVRVGPMEVVDGTAVIDIKSVADETHDQQLQ